MPINVEVPGVGTVEFPDGMAPEAIQGVLKKQFPQPTGISSGLGSGQPAPQLPSRREANPSGELKSWQPAKWWENPIAALRGEPAGKVNPQTDPQSAFAPESPKKPSDMMPAQLTPENAPIGGVARAGVNLVNKVTGGLADFVASPRGLATLMIPGILEASGAEGASALGSTLYKFLKSGERVNVGEMGMESAKGAGQTLGDKPQGETTQQAIERVGGAASDALFSAAMGAGAGLPEQVQAMIKPKTGNYVAPPQLDPRVMGFERLKANLGNIGGAPSGLPVKDGDASPPLRKQPVNKKDERDLGQVSPEVIAAAKGVKRPPPKPAPTYQPSTAEQKDLLEESGTYSLPPKLKTPEKELQGRDYLLSGPPAVRNEIKMDVGKASPEQVANRLQNLTTKGDYSQTEHQIYKDAGLDVKLKELQGKSDANEQLAKWMQEVGPRVEVVKASSSGPHEPEIQAMARLQHEWFDTLPQEAQAMADGYANNQGHPDIQSKIYNEFVTKFGEQKAEKLIDYSGLRQFRNRRSGNTNWQSIAPKSESEMPGYVEGAVVVPTRKPVGDERITGAKGEYASSSVQFPSSHSFPPNTLGFFRGYMEGDTFHVVEVQSDWASKVNEDKAQGREGDPGWENYKPRYANNPLLRDYERLTLKAAIQHAIEQGAKKIAVSDAETAMMTEGHDLAGVDTNGSLIGSYPTREQAYAAKERLDDATERYHTEREYVIKQNGSKWEVHRNLSKIPQEPGMRLHYDQILPRLLKELTGKEGEKVEFGEHKMAFEKVPGEVRLGTGEEFNGHPRKDLLFKNPDGTPKTSITARAFDLSEVKKRDAFSLFDKDKMPQTEQGKVKQAPPSVDNENQPVLKALGLDKKATVGDVFRKVASNDKQFSPQAVEFAKFMDKHFAHILDFARVDLDKHPDTRGAAYQYGGEGAHTVFLDAKNSSDIVGDFFHEATHAATHYLLEHPKTEVQEQASREIEDLRNLAIKNLPKGVRDFFRTYSKVMSDTKQNVTYDELQNHFEAAGLDAEKWHRVLYALQDRSEFVANIFNAPEFRDFLDGIRVENNKSIFRRVYDSMMKILGINPGTALEKTFDSMMKLGEDKELPVSLEKVRARLSEGVKQKPPMPTDKKDDALPAENLTWFKDNWFNDRGGRTFNEWKQQQVNGIARVSAPKMMAVAPKTGNAMIRWASADKAAPLIGRNLANQVLGEKWSDPKGFDLAGAALVEARLRAIRSGFVEQGNLEKMEAVKHVWNDPDSPIKSDAEYKEALKNPEVKAALSRFETLVQEPAGKLHERLGGKMASEDPETGLFANLIALQDAEGEDLAKEKFYSGGSAKGNLTTPMKRGSAFNKSAAGTAAKYDYSLRNMVERMVQKNYVEGTKRDFYDEMVKSGVGIIVKPGMERPEGFERMTIRQQKMIVKEEGAIKNFNQNEDLYVRNDVKNEVRQTMQTDSPVDFGAWNYILHGLTEAQLVGPVDITMHIANQFAAIAGSQGGDSAFLDVMRKIPGVREADTMVRMVKGVKDAILSDPEMVKFLKDLSLTVPLGEDSSLKIQPFKNLKQSENSPSIQTEQAKLAKTGAWRTGGNHTDLLSRLLPTNEIIQIMDKGARLSMSRMYDNLVARGWVKDTEEGRREYVNKLGQYNPRLMTWGEQRLKDSGFSPFIVAGKNFNRLAIQRLLLDPGVKAANPEAFAKMKVIEVVGWIATLMVLPQVINHFTTGSPWGRPGTPLGAIDTGQDDEKGRPKVVDLVKNVLGRRALNNTGVSSAYRDAKQERSKSEMFYDAFKEIGMGYTSPLLGPGVRSLAVAATGYDVGGQLQSDDPHNVGKNLWAAITTTLNPSLGRAFQAYQDKTSQAAALAEPVERAIGYGVGRFPSLVEKELATPGVEKMNLQQRKDLQMKLEAKQDKSTLTPRDQLSIDNAQKAREVKVQAEVNHELQPSTQQWLKSQHLSMPGFEEYLTQTGVHVYLLPKEQEQYMKIMVGVYEDAVRKAKPFVERQGSQQQKEKVFGEFLRQAHGIARNKMRLLIGKE